jgi:hypothetical protein
VNNFFADDASINGNFWKSDDQMRELEELMANVLMCEPGALSITTSDCGTLFFPPVFPRPSM